VRRTGGISETPDSSKKTSQAEFARAPFDPRPLMRHPVLDRVLVAFLGLALGRCTLRSRTKARPPVTSSWTGRLGTIGRDSGLSI
jgi:hypothetical protein